jgi:peptidyl-prolyl cis-trans isomerase B (cyclophilin B)
MKKNYLLLFTLTLQLLYAVTVSGQGIDKPQYQIVTHRAGSYLGTFNIELFPLIAPLATNNFDSLVGAQAYDSTAFHRVVPGFVIQGGDPNSISGPVSTWGQGNPNQPTVPAEFSVVRHLRGRLGAARDANINSANSQFYICVANAFSLDGQYTVYGQVISGMEVVDTIVNSPRDANDVPLQKIEMFVTYTGVNDSVPDPPVLTQPAYDSTGVTATASFQWTTISSAVMYTIEFSTDSLFSTIEYTRDAGVNFTTFPLMQPATTYYWRVKSNNGGHESIYSNVYRFTSLGAAELIYPADSAVNVNLNPFFQWHPGLEATSYLLQVATNISFTASSIKVNLSGLVDTAVMAWGLTPNTQYYWRVRTSIGTHIGFYSSKYSFMTGTTIGINEAVKNAGGSIIQNVYPNPASDNMTIELKLNQPGQVTILLKDIKGTEVFSSSRNSSKTESREIIDVTTLKKGVYLLYVAAGGKEDMRKIEVN